MDTKEKEEEEDGGRTGRGGKGRKSRVHPGGVLLTFEQVEADLKKW